MRQLQRMEQQHKAEMLALENLKAGTDEVVRRTFEAQRAQHQASKQRLATQILQTVMERSHRRTSLLLSFSSWRGAVATMKNTQITAERRELETRVQTQRQQLSRCKQEVDRAREEAAKYRTLQQNQMQQLKRMEQQEQQREGKTDSIVGIEEQWRERFDRYVSQWVGDLLIDE